MNFKLSYERKAKTMINSCLRIYLLNSLYPIVGDSGVGDSDVGDSDVGDFMIVIDLRCWWRNHHVVDFFRYVSDFLTILNSPTS